MAARTSSMLQRLDSEHVAAALELLHAGDLAARFQSPADLEVWLAAPGHGGWVVVEDGAVVAVGLAHRLEQLEADELLEHWPGADVRVGDGYFTYATTAASHRGQGLHVRLIVARLVWFASLGVEQVFTTSWRTPLHSSYGPLLRCGFVDRGSVAEYWPGYPDAATLMSFEIAER